WSDRGHEYRTQRLQGSGTVRRTVEELLPHEGPLHHGPHGPPPSELRGRISLSRPRWPFRSPPAFRARRSRTWFDALLRKRPPSRRRPPPPAPYRCLRSGAPRGGGSSSPP